MNLPEKSKRDLYRIKIARYAINHFQDVIIDIITAQSIPRALILFLPLMIFMMLKTHFYITRMKEPKSQIQALVLPLGKLNSKYPKSSLLTTWKELFLKL